MIKIDTALLSIIQTAYLWLWDRVGVTVGMLVFPLCVASYVIDTRMSTTDPLLWLGIGAGGMWSGIMHHHQTTSLAAFNLRSRQWSSSSVRVGIVATMVVFTLIHLIQLKSPLVIASDLISVLWIGYLPALQLRDREPPTRHSYQFSQSGS